MLFLLYGFRSRAVLYYLLQWICGRWNHNRATLSSFVSQTLCNSLVTESKYYRIGGGFVGKGGWCILCILLGRATFNSLKMWDEIPRNNCWVHALWNQILVQVWKEIFICTHLKGNFFNRGNISAMGSMLSFTKNEGHGWVITCFGIEKAFFTIFLPWSKDDGIIFSEKSKGSALPYHNVQPIYGDS